MTGTSGIQKGKSAGGWMPLNTGGRQKSSGENDVARGAVGGAKSVDAADNRTQVMFNPRLMRQDFFPDTLKHSIFTQNDF